MEAVADKPTVSTEDRSKWRYENFGAAHQAGVAFGEWLDIFASDIEAGRSLVTAESWPLWEAAARDGSLKHLAVEVTHYTSQVRYPADGIAYVFCPILHPDETEGHLIESPQPMWLNVLTLLQVEGKWLVHQAGPMIPPAELGKVAYSW